MCAPPNIRAKPRVAGYYPTLSFSADYGVAGQHPTDRHARRLRRPRHAEHSDFSGRQRARRCAAGRRAAAAEPRALENLRAQIDADVRTALFNLQSSAEQVDVAQSNIDLAEQTLTQSSDRFAAGVTDTVEVVQAQEAVASAHDNIFPVCTPTTTPRFLWLARWAWPKRA